MTQKLAFIVAAGGLILLGRRVPRVRAISASLAAALAARAFARQRHALERVPVDHAQETAVDRAVEASFPASDPPSYTATSGVGGVHSRVE